MAQLINGTTIAGHTAIHAGNLSAHSIATTTYVTTQINNLINGAPGALDTLNELAAALGNDASFSTSITNSISAKVAKSGDTMTGELVFSMSAPQIRFADTDHYDHWIHVNSNRFYILSDRNGDGSWETPYPMELNSETNVAYMFGNTVIHSGNIGSYALTSLPSHTHDDRYYTEGEVDSLVGNRLYQARVTIDVNASSDTGLYRGSTSGWSNRPTVVHNGGALLHIDTHPGGYYSQLFFDTGGDRLYFRNQNGGSWGSWLTMIHSGNIGSQSVSYATTAGSISGYNNPTTSSTANTIAYRDAGGDLYARYMFAVHFNQSGGNSENPTIGQIWTQNTSDNYVRKSTPAHFISQLGLITTGNIGSQSVSYATTAGALTSMNISQFTNNSGYITGESDTLGTVTGRGASTGTFATFSGGLSVSSGTLYFRGSDTERIQGEGWAMGIYGYNNNDGFLFYQRDTSGNPHPTFHIGGWNNASYGGWSNADSMITLVRGDGTNSTGTTYATRGLSNSSYYTNIVKTTSATVFKDAQSLHQFTGRVTTVTLGVTNTVSGAEVLTVDGVNGRLFSVVDDLTDSLFSVNTIAGFPVIEAYANNVVTIGKFGTNAIYVGQDGRVGFGTTDFSYTAADQGSPTNNRVFVNGSIQLLGNNDAIVFGRGTGTVLKDENLLFGWGGGWYMQDASYIRSVGNKAISLGGGSADYIGSIYMNGGVYIQTYNDRNLIIKGSSSSDAGIEGRNSANSNVFQIYGNGSDYGFLNGTWAAWDIKKTKNGAMYMNDNNSYYLHTNSTTNLYALTIQGATVATQSWVQSQGYLTSAGSYLPYGNWTGNSGLNDYKLYLRTNGDNNHYLWNAADDWEELNAYEGTGFRITSVGGTVGVLYVYGSTNGGYTYSPYSFRAPIFYDSNNTTYYGDFASISSMYGVAIRGDQSSTDTSNQIFFWDAGNTTTSAIGFKANGGNFSNPTGNGDGYNTYFSMDTNGRGWVFRRATGGSDFSAAYTSGWILNNGIWQANASMRAPIFYDSDDTGYYADFNSTSNSAIRLRGGMLIGPNTTWGAYLQVGGNGHVSTSYANIVTTNGNLHLDASSGRAIYLGNYVNSTIYLNTSGYYINSDGSYYNGRSEYVTINYNNNSNSTYQLLWGSGNSVYGTAEVYVNPSNDHIYASGFYAGSDIYLGTRGTWLSSWLNQALLTTSDPTHNSLYLANGNLRLYQGSGTALHIQTAYGYGILGPQNSSWFHFETDRPNFYFGRSIYVNGSVWIYGGSQLVENNGGTWSINISGTAARATRANGNFYIDDNYGNTVVGNYSSTRFQGVYAMGDSYKISADGTSLSTLYGLAWTHSNVGGQGGYVSGHQLLVVANGQTLTAISTDIWARGNISANGGVYDSGSRVAISRGEGRNYVDYSRYVYNNGAYSGSGWIEPSDLGVRYANSAGNSDTVDGFHADSFFRNLGFGSGYPSWDANTMDENRSGFTYSNNAPLTGCIAYFGASGYGMQLNGNYNGDLFSIRSRNGDAGSWRPWKRLITDYNIGDYKANGALKLWAESHPNDYYIVNNWTGSYWRLTTNHGSPVQVGYADNAGNSSNTSSVSNATGNSYTWTATNYFRSTGGGYSGSLASPPLQAYSGGNESAYMSFHKGGHYAVNMGLDADNVFRIGGWSASSNRLQMDMSGNLTMAGDVTAFSDARVKTNVKTIENALDKTLALRGVSYNRTDSDDTKTKIGVIAQETLEVVPEVVNQDNSGMYNVSYGNMAALFIEAIKEQQAQIEELKSEIKKLRGE